jgi:hypothetical protein
MERYNVSLRTFARWPNRCSATVCLELHRSERMTTDQIIEKLVAAVPTPKSGM